MESKLENCKELTQKARYPEAYDQVWEVLRVADSLSNNSLKFAAYKKLAMLYAIFNKDDEALACVDSMFHYFSNENERLGMNYSASLIYRMNKQYDCASTYLGVCEKILDSLDTPVEEKVYVISQRALLEVKKGNLTKAEDILNKLAKNVSPTGNYASMYQSIWGDLCLANGNYEKAMYHYQASLNHITKSKVRVGLRVGLLKKISSINQHFGNYKQAYEQMNESKVLGDSLFGSRSERNKALFEIKDSYRKAIQRHQKAQRLQQLKMLKLEKEKLNERLTYISVLLVTILGASVIVFRLVKRKHLIEKQLEQEHLNAQLEIKNKELTVTALQLIEKGQLLEEVKEGLNKVQQKEGKVSINQVKQVIKHNSTNTWEEFETRFVQVNGKFYESLRKKHEGLSPNELKLCALVKLNFSSKEMAQLMGVTPESINKARYRLRKKLNLNREDNLVTYINTI